MLLALFPRPLPDVAPTNPWRAALALCALALAACGGGADTPGASSTDASADAAADELFDTQFGQVCRGTGQPRAAAHAPGPGVHPLLAMRSDNGTDYHGTTATLPAGWGAQWPDLERTELVACVRRVSAAPREVCEGYSDDDTGVSWSVQTHDVVYEYTVRVAQSAEVLGQRTFEVPAGSCPMFSTYRDGDPQPQPYYPGVSDGEVELFVRPFVTGA